MLGLTQRAQKVKPTFVQQSVRVEEFVRDERVAQMRVDEHCLREKGVTSAHASQFVQNPSICVLVAQQLRYTFAKQTQRG